MAIRHLKYVLISVALSAALLACSPQQTDRPQERNEQFVANPATMLTASCSGCHGANGTAIVPLEGYSASSLSLALNRYRTETEGQTVMHRIMRGFDEAEISEIAELLGEPDD